VNAIEFTVTGTPPVKYMMGPQRKKLAPKVKEAKQKLAETAHAALDKYRKNLGQVGEAFPWNPMNSQLSLHIAFRRAKSELDSANIVGGVADALQNVLYADDKQITRIVYSEEKGEQDEYTVKVEREGLI
jgi:Holliday junction resolvase RusA-like endonuclease